MDKQIFIVGCSNESMNAAIIMASLDKKVTFICGSGEIEDVLNHYRFERQMVSLWDLYFREGKIQVNLDIFHTLSQQFTNEKNKKALIWLFLDVIEQINFQAISDALSSPHLEVILSGLTPLGQAQQVADSLNSQWVYYLPLIFMKDGSSFSSMLRPELVLIGEKTTETAYRSEILQFFLKNCEKKFFGDIKTIEFTRSTIMGMLATRLSFMNELARLADIQAVDIQSVQQVLAMDSRIGTDYLSAGWGFGGKTLPTELELLRQNFVENQVGCSLLNAVSAINEDQKELIFRKFWRHFDGFIEDKTVVIWGAGYRNGTGRTTNSAIHPLLKLLWSYRIKTLIFAINTAFELKEQYEDNPLFAMVEEAYQPLSKADALFIINWSIDTLPNVYELNKFAIPIFDARNVLPNNLANKLISKYYGIGR